MVKHLTSDKSTKTKPHKNLTTPLLLLFLLFSFQLFAQIPSGYYDAASGKSGDQLKASLHDIIKGHTTYPYTSSSTDTWDILKEADRDPNNSANVIGIYSAFSMDGAAEYNSGQGWNREHVWAKSRGDFGTSTGAGTDCHHLRAADISTNSARNNRNFDNAPTQYIDGDGPTNSYTDYGGQAEDWIWEPRDEVKGDVARMIFYMATRYEGENGEPDLELTESLLPGTGEDSKLPLQARLSVLLEWHQIDPVSDAERSRNDIIFGYQNNRNPYIDHPEYVCLIYSCDGGATNTAPSFSSTAVTSITEGETYQYNITTSDAEGDVISITATTLPSWLTFTDNTDGTALLTGVSSSAEVGNHEVVLSATDGDLSTDHSFTITVSAAGTGSGTDTASDLFISQYIEGSSFNKGLEIANFTGADVDLSNYSLFKQTNGAGEWASELVLSGTLADGDVYVIVHPSADAAMQAEADLITGAGALTFNGNDPVALFKQGTILDVIGVFNVTTDYAKDITLVRKPTITSPNTTYTISEWEEFATDTFDDLGSHTINLGSGETDTEAPSVPTALTASDITASSFLIEWDASTDNIAVTNYTVYLNGQATATVGITSFTFTGLTAATDYQVSVVANDAAGNSSAASTAISVSTVSNTDNEAPTAPQNVQVGNVAGSSFDISWDASTDNIAVKYYMILLDGNVIDSTTNTNYTVTDLTASTTYVVNIIAKDAAGNNSELSSALSVTTTAGSDAEAPSQVAGLAASNISATSFMLAWNAASDNIAVVAYDLYLDDTFVVSVATTTYEFTDLDPSTSYGVYVIAKDAAGNESTESEVLAVSTTEAPDVEAPTAPTGLSASNVSDTYLDLSWSPSSDNVGVVGYDVFIDGAFYTTTSSASIGIADLTAATNYTFTVFAKDAADNISSSSVSLSVTTLAGPDTEAPTSPTSLSATSIGQNSISFSWNASDDNIAVEAYKVFIDGLLRNTTADLSFTVLGLEANTTYVVGVSALDRANNESSITEIVVTTADDQVQGPVVLSENYFEAGWDDWVSGGSNAVYYNGSYAFEGNNAIRITDDNGEESSMTTIPLDINSYNQVGFEFYFYSNRMDYGDQFEIAYYDGQTWNTVSTFTEGVDFQDRNFYVATVYIDRGFYSFPQMAQFRIQGLADNKRDQLYFDQITITGLSSDSALRQTSEGLLTTIERVAGEVTINDQVVTYPNPVFDGNLHIRKEYEEETELALKLMDMNGNVIYQSVESVEIGLYHKVIPTTSLSSGIYFIHISDGFGNVSLEKILIR